MQREYLHPSISNRDAISLIKEKIKNESPFSFARFGDGEIQLLENKGSSKFKQRACSNWGYQYPNEVPLLYKHASQILKRALKKSDLVGFMDSNSSSVNLKYNPKLWSLPKSTLIDWGIKESDLKICDHQLPRSLEFGSAKAFKQVLGGKSLHIISPNTEALKTKNLQSLLEAEVTFTYHPKSVNLTNREEFLTQFQSIKAQVVITGTGLHKDYNVILKEKYGKTALDFGSTLDAWAGLYTKHWFKEGGGQSHLIL